MIRLLVTAAILVVATLSGHGWAASETDIVSKRQAAVLAASAGPSSPGRRQQVQRALREMFDYRAMARAIEAQRHWDELTAADRAELHTLLRRVLLHHHEQLLEIVRHDKLRVRVIRPPKAAPRGVVSAVATTPDTETSYALSYTVKGPKVVDLAIDGVSMVKLWRTQVSSLLRNNRLNELKDKLRAKIAKVPAYQPGQPLSEGSAAVLMVGLTAAGAYLVTCGVAQYFGARPRLCR
ncbi:MAG: ABC transporter substrate-binding protein [Deltaproteobacteria bacterium]|nr:ABC transporter substrate-binding protein [Deltaproteobacteria bacterium]